MGYIGIRTESSAPQGWIVLNQPEKRNPLSTTTVAEISDALRAFERDATIRAVLITGEGKFFSAGADLRDLAVRSPLEDRSDYNAWIELHQVVAQMRKPVIALVNGPVVGGSAALVGLADLAIASDRATFAYAQIDRGIGIGIAVVTLLRSAPRKKAVELSLLANRIDAQEAERIGLVNRVVPHDELTAAGEAMVAALAQKSPIAVAFTKEACHVLPDLPFVTAMERSRDLRVISRTSADAEEGITSFLEKRRPVWTGV
ncbi:MAG: enoyl-CoA hydratase/isomerase family protein [Chloroflexi bacterium]|nr:enoyl-CoA hydratase/isomerase family protein [Chloroflexota bacterium]